MEDRFGRGSRESMAGASKERMEHLAEQQRVEEEVKHVHAEQAAERGEMPPAKTPWWRFWRKEKP